MKNLGTKGLEKKETVAMETGRELNELGSVLDTGVGVSEIVKKSVGEDLPTGKAIGASIADDTVGGGIMQKISDLLFSKEPKEIVLPATDVQLKKLKKSLEINTKRLMKEARKVESARKFSANKLEKIVEQIRYLQKLLEEILFATADRIEILYRRFVMGIS